MDEEDFLRFLTCLREFNRQEAIGSLYEKSLREKKNGSSAPFVGAELPVPALVEIIAYCLNPNHYHLILKQNSEKGIERFMHKLSIELRQEPSLAELTYKACPVTREASFTGFIKFVKFVKFIKFIKFVMFLKLKPIQESSSERFSSLDNKIVKKSNLFSLFYLLG